MSTRHFLIVLLLGAAATLAGPDSTTAPPPSTKPDAPSSAVSAPKPQSDYPVIGYIEKQGRTITIKAGPKGTLYSVKTSDGKVLHENVSAEQLRAQAPELHEFLKNAVAGAGNSTDARLRPGKLDARF